MLPLCIHVSVYVDDGIEDEDDSSLSAYCSFQFLCSGESGHKQLAAEWASSKHEAKRQEWPSRTVLGTQKS